MSLTTTLKRLSIPMFCLLVVGLSAGCSWTDERAEKTTGGPPYAVGSSTVFIHDRSRSFDSVAGVDSGVRTLITELWYPVEKDAIGEGTEAATYGDYVFGNRHVHRQMMTQTTFFHLTPDTVRAGVTREQIDAAIAELFERERGSYKGVPVAGPGPFPVVVMTHGDAGSRYNMETACEYLAAHGYIVIAPEHTGNSPFSMIGADPELAADGGDQALRESMVGVLAMLDENGVYGDPERFGQSYTPLPAGLTPGGFATLDRSLVERVDDLRAALDYLEKLNRKGAFAGRVDLSRVGLIGRSFGGATTLAALAMDERFDAGFAVVPPSLPDLRPALPANMLVQPPAESVLLAPTGDTGLSQLSKPTLLLVGGEDRLILGLAGQLAEATGTSPPSPDNHYPVLQSAVESARVPAALALVQNTNHASFGVAGPFWWPQLKPDTFSRFFVPEQNYTLLDSEIAHQLQQQMALAFFDLMLRGDSESLELMRSNPWQQYQTHLLLRNFAGSH